MKSKNFLWAECVLLFGLVPLVAALLKPHGWMYVMLWVFAFLSWHWLKQHHYNLKKDWNKAALDKTLIISMLWRWLPFAIALGIFTALMIPEHLFSLPRRSPELWVMVMILYPLLSVVPQEIIFRSFFFKRYAALFPTPRLMILFSALAFGWVHILLLNWVAVTFGACGGLIFGSTYNKTKSLAAACLEHALYGCTLFTLGMGYYFYHGQAVH